MTGKIKNLERKNHHLKKPKRKTCILHAFSSVVKLHGVNN